MRSVYSGAGINPKDTGYVEAHGTGTKVGDPIEAAALYKVFGEDRSARNPLFIGSVKSNVGHLEAASGEFTRSFRGRLLNTWHRYHIGDQGSDDARARFYLTKLRLQEAKRENSFLQMASEGNHNGSL